MKSILDWSDYQDQGMGDAYADIPKHGGHYAKAVSVCISSGLCEQNDNRRVMCPSFRVTPEPIFSPGGRVKLLKHALNNNFENLSKDAALTASMESCVSCKGCKRECENNLDIATVKAEYLAQRRKQGHKVHRLRSWLFGYFPKLVIEFPLLAFLIRMRNNSEWLKKLAEKLMGINAKANLPEPAKKPFSSNRPLSPESADVVLLVDSFTAIFQPEVAEDAIHLFERLGLAFDVIYPSRLNSVDSGRSLFSQGYLEAARDSALNLVETLNPYIERGVKVIGLEPSAHLMLRDEFLMLGLAEKGKQLASLTLLLEEYLARSDLSTLNLHCAEANKVLIQGHCHQKAAGAKKSLRKALKKVEGLSFEFIEGSCCGMAGSFGLEAENAADSLAMAELSLMPALRANPNACVISNGFSCTQQIKNLDGRSAVHLASFLRRCMG